MPQKEFLSMLRPVTREASLTRRLAQSCSCLEIVPPKLSWTNVTKLFLNHLNTPLRSNTSLMSA